MIIINEIMFLYIFYKNLNGPAGNLLVGINSYFSLFSWIGGELDMVESPLLPIAQ